MFSLIFDVKKFYIIIFLWEYIVMFMDYKFEYIKKYLKKDKRFLFCFKRKNLKNFLN